MKNLNQEAELERKDGRRFLVILISICSLVLVGLAAFMVFYDCPPPDDSDMLPRRNPVPDQSNPLAQLLDSFSPKQYSEFQKEVSLDKKFKRLEFSGIEKKRLFLQEHEEMLKAFDLLRSSELERMRWPDTNNQQSMGDLYKGRNARDTVSVSALIHAEELRIQVLFASGGDKEAFRRCMDLLLLGSALDASQPSGMQFFCGSLCRSSALRCLAWMLPQSTRSSEELSEFKNQLTQKEVSRADVGFAISAEYQALKNSIISFKHTNASFDISGRPDELNNLLRLFIKPQMSNNLLLDLNRPIRLGIKKSWGSAVQALKITEQKNLEYKMAWPRSWLSPNATGEYIIHALLGNAGGLLYIAAESLNSQRQGSIILALRQFELMNGHLPELLDELVPEYLQDVPLDPYDDKPMRWNKESSKVYSVGRNLRDDGGSFSFSGNRKDLDRGMIYWWSDVAKIAREEQAKSYEKNK
jgi:hypothetical protein